MIIIVAVFYRKTISCLESFDIYYLFSCHKICFLKMASEVKKFATFLEHCYLLLKVSKEIERFKEGLIK
jgi:hypothetical protein